VNRFRPLRRLAILGLAIAVASPAWAKRDSKGREIEVWAGEPLFALTSPWSGARLAAGESVRLAWNEEAALGGEGWIEEWEVFLSLDAGRSYTVRITPHLDIGKRTFSVKLPEIPTRDARLMFRMGNERRELELELPWTFEIVDARSLDGRARNRAFARGEAARSGDPGVATWVEGGRDGSGIVEFAADLPYSGMRSVGVNTGIAIPAIGTGSRTQVFSLRALFSRLPTETACSSRAPLVVAARSSSLDPRRSTCRQNE
jgi:hypothetical protein